ncbi:MAG: hypothetical protein M1827_001509 [Pycnora praestabilis]|nr:MAG: hypothetical protein M1827_001509 [Pycnora praestabilis]
MPSLICIGFNTYSRQNPLDITEFATGIKEGTLTPRTKAHGFKCKINFDEKPSQFADEQEYVKAYHKFFGTSITKVAIEYGITPSDLGYDTTTNTIRLSSKSAPSSFNASIEEALRESQQTKELVPVKMPTSSPLARDSGLSPVAEHAVVSPARGKQMAQQLYKQIRPFPLKHGWAWWHDRVDRSDSPSRKAAIAAAAANGMKPAEPVHDKDKDSLQEMGEMYDIKAFWTLINNFPFDIMRLRDTVYLTHKHIKPIWEDPRNEHGGSWTFRIPKDFSLDFFKEVMLMGIGETLQEVVEKGDDICAIGMSIRFNSNLITIWNRRGDNQKSIDAILALVLENISPALKPKETHYYYKKHSEHQGYAEAIAKAKAAAEKKKLKEEAKKAEVKKAEEEALAKKLEETTFSDEEDGIEGGEVMEAKTGGDEAGDKEVAEGKTSADKLVKGEAKEEADAEKVE